MSEAIDLPDVMERVQDDKELLLELFVIFQEDFQKKRPVLGEAIATGDVGKVREIAHGVKGASGNISAKALHAACLKLEMMAKDNTTAGMQDVLADIDVQFARVMEFAAKLKKEWGG